MSVVQTVCVILISLCGGFVFVACSSHPHSIDATLPDARTAIYTRAKVEFAETVFYKPNDSWSDELGSQLTPLFFQETNVLGSSTTHHFGRLIANGRTVNIDRSIPTVYFRNTKINLKGAERNQAIFLWFHVQGGKIRPQGVRITLDKNNHPAIWEILHDTSGIQQIFVSQSLENIAISEFGNPYSGRNSALEQPVSETPDVVVARVISDGPMTMGPAIYLTAKDNDVATLICRCMPAQTKSIAASAEYEIVPIDDERTKILLRGTSKIVDRILQEKSAECLESKLRLPNTF